MINNNFKKIFRSRTMTLFQRTRADTRNYGVAVLVGIIGGILSAFVKSGTEGILPPRLPGVTPPPVELLQELGVNLQNMVYTYSDQVINWGGNGVHILFSIVFGVIYCVIAEIFPKVKLGQGLVFALLVVIAFHGICLPVLNLSPAVWNLSADEIYSELIGTCLWMWTIEIVRRDLRNRMTQKPDPEHQ